jgi:peptidoglycan L-alanyl-D-glutamate endopeptidase CwlK
MGAFSTTSLTRLSTCEEQLQTLFKAVVVEHDCSIIEGHRGEMAQNAAVAAGKSKTPWPTSKHNSWPSKAADAAPYPLPAWNDRAAFEEFGFQVLAVAKRLGIKIRWGGDWNQNGKTDDEKFLDLVHFELAE